jgi:hypothetical protein
MLPSFENDVMQGGSATRELKLQAFSRRASSSLSVKAPVLSAVLQKWKRVQPTIGRTLDTFYGMLLHA